MKTQLSIQEKLWELRKDKKLGQKEVAQAIGVSTGTVSNYENDEYKDISLSLLSISFVKNCKLTMKNCRLKNIKL